MRLHLGIADHFGWAVAVTASHDHEVVDRRRLELVEPHVTPAPIHYDSKNLDVVATAALVEEVRGSVERTATTVIDELVADLHAPIRSISLRTWPADFPDDIAVQREVPHEARADAIMYRQILAELAQQRGWAVHLYVAKDVIGQAGDVLALPAEEYLQAPRATLGAPWTKDHRVAFAAAIVAGSG